MLVIINLRRISAEHSLFCFKSELFINIWTFNQVRVLTKQKTFDVESDPDLGPGSLCNVPTEAQPVSQCAAICSSLTWI